MTPELIADSIVNLCGAIGLAVAMATFYRRDPKSPLTRRLLIAAAPPADRELTPRPPTTYPR